MKIFLINPACLDKRVVEDDAVSIPIGLFYIGACAIEKGFNVKIVNLAVEKKPFDHLKKLMTTEKPDILGFSVLSSTRFSAMEAAQAAKKIDPHIKIIFGGPEATFLVKHLFSTCKALDYIIKGEGEISFLKLADHINAVKSALNLNLKTKSLQHNNLQHDNLQHDKQISGFQSGLSDKIIYPDHIKGLAYRKDGKIIETEQGKKIENLDTLPNPGKYFDFNHISLSRGCPGNCKFCGSPAFWGKSKVRFHSPDWFVNEIESLVKRGITHFFVSDDTFTMDKERVIEVCKKIISRGLEITWVAISRVDFIDEDILFYMRKAGCTQISFGVESGSATIRKALGKPVKKEKIIKTFHMTASFGILPRAYFIYGSPQENEQTIKESIDLILEIKPLSVIFYILVVFPGTALYRDLCLKGILTDDVWKEKIEDIPWFELDPNLDFNMVKTFGKKLRHCFFSNLNDFALNIELVDNKELYKSHADFLSRLGMTFSHGDFAGNKQIKDKDATAEKLYFRALSYSPDFRAYLGLGMLFQKKRDFKKAAAILKKGLNHFPDIKSLNLCMAICLMNTGDFRSARKYLEKFKNDSDVIPYINACREACRENMDKT